MQSTEGGLGLGLELVLWLVLWLGLELVLWLLVRIGLHFRVSIG